MLLLAALLSAEASPYAVRVVGRLDSVLDTTGALNGLVQTGDPVVFTYAYDDTGVDTDPDPQGGVYRFSAPDFLVEVDVGTLSFETGPTAWVELYLRTGGFAQYHARSALTVVRRGPALLDRPAALFILQDITGQALSSVALPSTPPVLSDWPPNYPLQLSTYGGGGREWLMTSSAAFVRPVPYLRARAAGQQTDVFASGLTPRRPVAVLTAADRGRTVVPAGPCAGASVALDAPVVQTTLVANAAGEVALQTTLPPALQGQRLVFFDLTTCTASTTATLP